MAVGVRGEKIADCINTIGRFCGKQDITDLCQGGLETSCGISQADIMILFGGSILCGGDLLAKGMQNKIAKKYMIVGGHGHTTPSLRAAIGNKYPQLGSQDLREAELFSGYLEHRYNLQVDYLEKKSTNCGNNVTNCLALMEREQMSPNSILVIQDATMQRRMEAGFKKYLRENIKIINCPAYRATVIFRGGRLQYDTDIDGMWSIDRYITLLMGEIPRLTDNANGYGPRGKGYIAHVGIPHEVKAAYEFLLQDYGDRVRTADSRFASASQD